MNEIEKRELFEQQRKIFEAGAQRVDRRTGSFSFLTWSFFIAPLIACEEFLAAMFKSAAAEEEDASAAQADAAPQAANDHPPTSDLSKASAQDATAKGPAAASEAHAAQLDPIGPLARPHEDAPKPGTARNEAIADANSGGGGGGDDADSRHHGAHTSIDDSSVDSHFGSSPFPGGSTLESVQSIVLGGSFSPAINGSAPPLGTVGGLSNDVVGGIAPVEAAAQPTLAPVTDTGSTLSHDVAGTTAPVEVAAQPMLATATDAVSTLSHDVVGTTAPVEAAVQPVLATATDSVTVSTLSHDVVGTTAPVEMATQPVLPTATDAASTLNHDVASTIAPVEAAVQPVLATATDAGSTLSHDVAHPADTGNVAGDALASAAPAVHTTEPVTTTAAALSNLTSDVSHPADALLALATATDAPIEAPGPATAGPANVATGVSHAAASVDQTTTAGDVIALNDAPPPQANALFTGTQYTQYGVTLSSDVAVPAQHAASPTDAISAHDTSVPVVADIQQHAPPSPETMDTTHLIDHHAIL